MILEILYFFIPSYVSNMMPVFVKKINFLDIPIDFGKTVNRKRILGANKTWRGFFFGILGAIITFEIQRLAYNLGLTRFALINYSLAPFFLGALLGFSALFGDGVESYFKRRLNIAPGRPWLPFDQLDFLIFSMLFTLYWSEISLKSSLLVLSIVFVGTIIVQYSAYLLKLKKDIL